MAKGFCEASSLGRPNYSNGTIVHATQNDEIDGNGISYIAPSDGFITACVRIGNSTQVSVKINGITVWNFYMHEMSSATSAVAPQVSSGIIPISKGEQFNISRTWGQYCYTTTDGIKFFPVK